MSGFDIVIVGVFVISIVVGIMRGLIKEALSIISWIVAIWLAISLKTMAGDWFAQFINIPNATFRGWIGFTLVFVVTLFVFAVINFVITKLLVRGPIQATDRALGIFFGAARAGLIVVALVIVLRGLGLADSDWWQDSRLVAYFEPAANTLEPLIFEQIPEEVTDQESLQRQVLDQAVDRLAAPESLSPSEESVDESGSTQIDESN